MSWKDATLEEAKEWLRERVNVGAPCPCCTQLAKVYKRQINSSMAYVLILIDRYFRKETDWLHVPSYLTGLGLEPRLSAAFRGDWAKLTYWGLLEEKVEARDDGSPRAGYYRITPTGKAFVQAALRVPKFVHLYDGRVMERSNSETISIEDALASKFNYRDLMKE